MTRAGSRSARKAASGRSSVHRRGDGDGWEGWVSLGTDPRTGKRRRKHVRGRTKAEVDDKIKTLETARDSGVAISGSDVTVSAYLDRWVAARTKVVRPNTLSGYRTDLLHVERSGIGRIKLRALTPEDVEQLYAAVLDSGCKPGSVAHVRRTVSAAMNVAARRREHVWWPAWVGRGAHAWHGGVLAVFWPVLFWAFGTGLLWAAGHTLRLLIIATMLGWLGVACCAAAAVLPFAGGVLVLVSLFRPAPTSDGRTRALRRPTSP